MSDENIEDFGFPVKEEFEMQQEGEVQTEEVENTEEEKTEEEVREEVAESNEEEIKEEVGAIKEDQTEEVKEEVVETEEVEAKSDSKEVEPEKIDTSSLIRDEISEATDGQFSSVEEMKQALDDALEYETGSSYLKKINDAVEEEYGEGVTFSDLVEYKARDFKNMHDLDILEEHLNFKDGNISEAVINAEMRPFALLMKSKSEIDELIEDGEITQTEVDDLSARLTRKAYGARNELMEYQESINIDNLEISSPKVTEKPVPEVSEEEREANLERYRVAIDGFSEVKLNLGTKEDPSEFTQQVTEDDRKGITDFLSGDSVDGVQRDFIQKNWTKDGNVDMEKLSRDMYKVINYERDMKRAYANGKSEVSKEVKDINNLDFKKGDTKAPQTTNDADQAAQMAREANG